MILHTPRLRLEPFVDEHFDGLWLLNSDPVVMRYVGGPETEEELRETIRRVKERWRTLGFSWWAFVAKASDEIVGAGCVQHIENDARQPLEIGWRLSPEHWGKGLATEAAEAMAKFAFNSLRASCVYAIAHPDNAASVRVMQRLGMQSLGLEPHYGTDCPTYILKDPL